MKTLTIYPTFLCPFACNFCFNKDKLIYNEYLKLETLQNLLSNHNNFDKIIISGGEPSNFPHPYSNALFDIVTEYGKPVEVKCYPYSLDNYDERVNYNFSFDFLVRVRANDAWECMLRMPKKFNITMLLTPMLMKSYHPNNIFKKLSLLPNLKQIELVPYFKNNSTTWNMNNQYIENYMKAWLSSSLNYNFINYNKEKMRALADKPSKIIIDKIDNFNLLPNGNLAIDYFNEQEIHSFKIITEKEIDTIIPSEISKLSIDLYNQKLLDWFKLNDL